MKTGLGAAAAIAAALLAACTTTPKPAPATMTLFKTNWTAVKINGQDVPVGAATISLDFGDHRITGTGGCNRYFGGYDENSPNLMVHNLGSTKMACAPEVMARENAYLSILGAAATFAETDRGALVVTAKDGRTVSLLPAGS